MERRLEQPVVKFFLDGPLYIDHPGGLTLYFGAFVRAPPRLIGNKNSHGVEMGWR